MWDRSIKHICYSIWPFLTFYPPINLTVAKLRIKPVSPCQTDFMSCHIHYWFCQKCLLYQSTYFNDKERNGLVFEWWIIVPAKTINTVTYNAQCNLLPLEISFSLTSAGLRCVQKVSSAQFNSENKEEKDTKKISSVFFLDFVILGIPRSAGKKAIRTLMFGICRSQSVAYT